ncbi:MAG: hypothetical protein HQ488_03375 [Parcubacteria group bacterium]|nr:hypothetical protein [Parcubacteria group bacterium]
MAILNIYKPLGWTPLECIDKIKATHPELVDSQITYTGRLDPMAEGVIVFLSDEDRFKKPEYQKLDKVYEATILFGLSSDTYDSLGIIKRGKDVKEEQILTALSQLTGEHLLPFPPYCSYKVGGKPLLLWAREGRLDEIEIPNKLMTVLEQSDVLVSTYPLKDIKNNIFERIDLVKKDFRQKEVIQSWNRLESVDEYFLTATLTLKVTSGTYIRALAHRLGDQLGCGALLFELKRTSVGSHHMNDSIRLTK